jgi:hypothetical protein
MARNHTLAVLLICVTAPSLFAQNLPGVLEGTIRDESGGVMRAVAVQVFASGDDDDSTQKPLRTATTNAEGRFSLTLPGGEYRVEVDVPSFAPFESIVAVGPDTRPLDIVLEIDLVGLSVDVRPADELRADTLASLTSTTISGDELLDLPRDEQDLAEYLLLLAGGDVTGDLEADVLSNFVIDGFEDGRLPSPDQIAQIIVDPNSLRADGQGPRIEIITRPGTGEWRGGVDFGFADPTSR